MRLTRLASFVVLLGSVSSIVSAQSHATIATAGDAGSVLAAQNNVPQPAQRAEDDVARTVTRYGIGVESGVALDPELLDIGVHGTFGPVFLRGVQFRPGIELGVGEVTTLFGVNLDVLYTLPGTTAQSRWAPYAGAGPNFALSHRGFESVNGTTGSRFDFSDTSFDAGFNFIAGVRNRNGLFLEMKATAYGVSNVRLLVGYNFSRRARAVNP